MNQKKWMVLGKSHFDQSAEKPMINYYVIEITIFEGTLYLEKYLCIGRMKFYEFRLWLERD